MKVGLTYDVRSAYMGMGYSEEDIAEFDRDDTITSIEAAIRAAGFTTDRIGNLRELVQRLSQGDRWDLVFNIAEGMHGFGREAQVPALLEAYGIPYTFSDPLVLALTLHKELTKRVVRSYGIPTPDFFLVSGARDVDRLTLPFPLFVKPVAEGTGKGIKADSIVRSRDSLVRVCNGLLDRYRQPVLVETFLSGREFTVGIVGTGSDAEAVGALEVIAQSNAEMDAGSFWNKENCEKVIIYKKASDACANRSIEIALDSWRVLGCRDGGRVDLRADEKGDVYFLEVNPLAGLHPEHSDLPILCKEAGMPYNTLIRKILTSALVRTDRHVEMKRS